MIKMLDADSARKLFQRTGLGRLGCMVENGPYVVPINFRLEGDYLYSHSLPGLKISSLRKNPRACVQVDEIESDVSFKSAIAFGIYEEITKENEREEFLARLLQQFPLLTPVESAIASDGYTPEVIVFRIKIDRFTGIKEG